MADVLQRARLASRGIRTRLLVWYVALFALSLLVGVLVLRTLLIARLDADIGADLAQEAGELRLLAAGTNPATGQPFGVDPQAIFTTYLANNVPSAGESFTFLIAGQPFAVSQGAPVDLGTDADLVAQWSQSTTPTWGETDTDKGPARWLAVPVTGPDGVDGTFVVSRFSEPERSEIDSAVQVAGVVAIGLLLLASALAYLTAGRVIAPIRRLTATARYVSDHDLSERLPVQGADEVAELTATFNDMLDRLEVAFSTQRRFLDDIGHELRTPLTIVRGHLELMPGSPAERAATIALCLDEIDRMNRYVSDLMLLARSVQPDFLRYAPTDVRDLTNGMLGRAQALAPDRLWLVTHADPVVIEADPERLTQAWLNLVNNAVRHTDSLEIDLGGQVTDGHARLWVRDSGPGVSDQDATRIFDRFEQGSVRSRTADGAGLGLAIAHAHGGRIDLASDAGHGATFTLVVPVRPEPGQPLETLEVAPS